MEEECRRRWQYLLLTNDKVNKHVRKYRAEYWAKNQVDTEFSKVAAHAEQEQLSALSTIMKQRQLKLPPYHKRKQQFKHDDESEEESDQSVDSELAEYDLNTGPLWYQIVWFAAKDPNESPTRTPAMRALKLTYMKLECSKPKSKNFTSHVLDLFSKKQQIQQYQTTQPQHLQSATAQQIEPAFQKLVQWIDS